MSESIHLKSGQLLELPVAPGHSLASHQSVQVPTHDELLAHPFYSRIISHLTDRARVNLAMTEGIAATLSNEHKSAIISTLKERIGVSWLYALGDITIESGAAMHFKGNYHQLVAGNIIIKAGGTIRVYTDNPSISATLMVSCSQFGQTIHPVLSAPSHNRRHDLIGAQHG